MRKTLALLVATVAIAPQLAAQSGIVYTNQACFCSNVHIVAYNEATGAVVQTYSGVQGNGRGVVVVGNVIYYTTSGNAGDGWFGGDPNIYMIDKTTGLPLGSILTTNTNMSTLGWDGSQFWASDYTGNNQAYHINLAGVTTSTITLPLSGNYYDGMEFFNGKLIANRFDGGYGGTNHYDIYDLSGNLLQADFIQSTPGTGIAYDGTNFLVSNLGNGFGVYNGVTGAFDHFVTYADGNYDIEDLSVDYAARQDTGNVTPEPATVLMMATGLIGVLGAGFVKRQAV